jgi:uncharacterized protein YfaS (alpha-2-macroglobulin family)
MKAAITLFLTVIVFLACSTFAPGTPRGAAAVSEKISVIVHTSSDPLRPVKGARVVILGSDGSELATSTTDASGTALVDYKPRVGARPLYVLVEATDCYLSGLRWEAGFSEYFILVTGRAAR